MTLTAEKTFTVEGIRIPDSKLAREITELVRDTESALLFHHSSRVYYWGALTGKRRGLTFDPELLYAGAMFHDMGLTPAAQQRHTSASRSTARTPPATSCAATASPQQDIETVWTAIALHTTPGIPQHMHPVVALVTAGVEMDVLGHRLLPNSPTPSAKRSCTRIRAPATSRKTSSRPSTTASSTSPRRPSATSRPMCSPTRIPHSGPTNFCSVIRGSAWPG